MVFRLARIAAAAAVAIVAALSPASAVVPETPLQLVAANTTDEAIVPFGTGFFAVWEETDPTLKSRLKGQLFTATGRPNGPSFDIDGRGQSVHDFGGTVVVPVDSARVAVFWYAFRSPIPNRAVHAAIVRPATRSIERTASPFVIDDYFLDAARLPDGSFVVAHTQYNAFTAPIREVVLVSRLSSTLQLLAQAPLNGDGDVHDGIMNSDFAVVSRQGGSLGLMKRRDMTRASQILAQRYDAAGKKVGAPYAINTTFMPRRSTFDYSPLEIKATRLAGGKILVSWVSLEGTITGGNTYEKYEVRARLLSAAGTPLGKDFLVNPLKPGMQEAPEVTALPTGGFVVSWVSTTTTGTTTLRHRIYDSNGKALTGSRISETGFSPALQRVTDTALLRDGSLVNIFRASFGFKAEGVKSTKP